MKFDLETFSQINLQRCERWHPKGINSWSSSDWLTAITGELGEAANMVKKQNRIRDGLAGNKPHETPEYIKAELEKEVADVFCYLDLFATANGINLAEAVVKKFNEISARNNFPERIDFRTHEERVAAFNRTYNENAARRGQYEP